MDQKHSLGETNLAALVALIIGSIGGLFALGLIPAIITRNLHYLAVAPTMNIISFFLCGGLGWLVGGQIGPRLSPPMLPKSAHITGGIIGGMIPILLVAAIGWYLATQPA